MDIDDKPKTRKVKKQVRKGELPVSAGTASLDQGTKDKLAELESSMIMEDKLVADTEEKKNELETYIYEMRNKIDDQYADFASDAEKAKLKEKLEASEVCCINFCLPNFANLHLRIGSTMKAKMPPRPST